LEHAQQPAVVGTKDYIGANFITSFYGSRGSTARVGITAQSSETNNIVTAFLFVVEVVCGQHEQDIKSVSGSFQPSVCIAILK